MSAPTDRVLIIGGTGQLGTDLLRTFADRMPIAPDRRLTELTEPAALRTLLTRYRPTIVINTAAYHNVEHCEVYPERAMAVNAVGVDMLAGLCAAANVPLLHISTDYVFDGKSGRAYREDDAAAPVNAYGISKLAGELLIRRHGPRHFIIRTSGLYGRAGSSTKGYTFIERVLGQAERGEPVRVVDDMVFSPSYTRDVAQTIRTIVESGRFGTYHVTNGGACSWYEFAEEAFRLAGLTPDLQAVKSASFDPFIERPMHSPLDPAALRAASLALPRSWRDGLAAYVSERSSRTAAVC